MRECSSQVRVMFAVFHESTDEQIHIFDVTVQRLQLKHEVVRDVIMYAIPLILVPELDIRRKTMISASLDVYGYKIAEYPWRRL